MFLDSVGLGSTLSFETKFVQIGWKMTKLFRLKEGKPAKKGNLRKSSLKFRLARG